MDLHTWITTRVDRTEEVAHAATAGPWYVTEYNWPTDFDAGIGTTPDGVQVVGHGYEGGGVELLADAVHIALHDPAAALRRCEADRRILARHELNADDCFESACRGCDLDSWGLPHTDNLNGCPELLDLAHAHGITDQELAGLDRPQPPERKSSGHWPTAPITTSDVLAALRGPNWKPRS